MLNQSTEINTPITVAFPRGSLVEVLPGNLDVDVIIGDTPSVVTVPAIAAVTDSIIVISYTPGTLGLHHIVVDGEVVANLEVVSRSIHLALESLEDVALGSWALDKGTDELVLYTQQGAVIATYDVIDTTAQTSREKK